MLDTGLYALVLKWDLKEEPQEIFDELRHYITWEPWGAVKTKSDRAKTFGRSFLDHRLVQRAQRTSPPSGRER